MRKVSSIFMIVVVLLSSLHFTIAAHYCGEEVASVKAGLEGTIASCGMETEKENDNDCPNHSDISSTDCCKNSLQVLSVDNFKISSLLEIQKVNFKLVQLILMPVYISRVLSFNRVSCTDEDSYHPLTGLSERLAFICIFRK